jgi:hypothetical protein
MTDTNIKHIDVGSELSKTEWEAANSHTVTPSIADDALLMMLLPLRTTWLYFRQLELKVCL